MSEAAKGWIRKGGAERERQAGQGLAGKGGGILSTLQSTPTRFFCAAATVVTATEWILGSSPRMTKGGKPAKAIAAGVQTNALPLLQLGFLSRICATSDDSV
jgi:hypothetical protein